jgi:hypothetical protein
MRTDKRRLMLSMLGIGLPATAGAGRAAARGAPERRQALAEREMVQGRNRRLEPYSLISGTQTCAGSAAYQRAIVPSARPR